MNSVIEKEKKLNLALSKLKNLNHENPSLANALQNLDGQKNQLEIEKKEIEEQKKELEFSEKIDELNQETDSLMTEIEKWQM